MKTKRVPTVIALLALLVSLIPAGSAVALGPIVIPPVDMFQLPWEQGLSWVAYDGFDNGFKRPLASPHNYVNGGAVDFAPHPNMRVGEDTSNFWVTAAAAGTVVQTTVCSLMIDHGNGWITDYKFLAHMQVKLGDAVFRNERLGVIADGLGEPFCPPALEPDVPHLHFSLRPNMRNATFAGWLISYIPLLNKTTFTRNGQSVGLFQPLLNGPGIQVVLREAIAWDTVYTGNVDGSRFERWPLSLTETTTFTVTATPTTSGLVPLLILLDANGNELARGTGTLTSTQPAGSYFVQVQPQAGAGFYTLIARKEAVPQPTEITGPHSSTSISPTSVAVGESAAVTVSLVNVPAGGYTSTEFTCTYNGTLVEASGITAGTLFGADPAVAISGPQNGSFIFAIAGSKGSKAATDGTAFTFSLKGLQAGQTAVECKARVSKGDNTLTAIPSSAATLNVGAVAPTPTPTSPGSSLPTPGATATETLAPSNTLVPPSPTASPTATATSPPTATATSTPTSTPTTSSTLTGQVNASKPVTVSLFNAEPSLVTSVAANSNGSFSLTAVPGTYTVVASAVGFLKAQGPVTLTDGQTSTMPTVSLLAGDIDGNNVIDQFDAMTIGMSYNTDTPAAADLNNDGVINLLDLELLAHNYRASGALAWV